MHSGTTNLLNLYCYISVDHDSSMFHDVHFLIESQRGDTWDFEHEQNAFIDSYQVILEPPIFPHQYIGAFCVRSVINWFSISILQYTGNWEMAKSQLCLLKRWWDDCILVKISPAISMSTSGSDIDLWPPPFSNRIVQFMWNEWWRGVGLVWIYRDVRILDAAW